MRGTTVTLYVENQTGVDAFNHPTYKEIPVQVAGVLIGEPTADDITSTTNLYGKKLECILGIPKGDTHDWTDKKVTWTDAYGAEHVFKTLGAPIVGIEANIPTRWHKKVRCVSYE